MFKIINYIDEYATQVNNLDEKYWGISETNKVSEEIKKNDIAKIALKDDTVIGLLHFKQVGDLIDCYHILVDDEYQHKGIASKLMESALNEVMNRNVKTLIAHAVEHDGVVNAQRLLEKFHFKKIYKVNNYWNSLYPNEYCKQCNSNECHCGVVVFIKEL